MFSDIVVIKLLVLFYFSSLYYSNLMGCTVR